MKRVIVTGATGFVGANLTRRLLCDGNEVHLLVRPDYTPWRISAIQSDVRLHEVHLEDPGSVLQVAKSIRPEWIFHLAAYGAYSWQIDFRQMLQTNLVNTINLVEACLRTGFEVLVNTGSSSEYGFKDHAPSEVESTEPNSYYAVTKASSTLYCGYVARSQGVRIPTLRLYSVYGPYEEPTRLIPALIVHGLAGQLPPLVSPHIARDYIYVNDVLEAYQLAAERADAPPDAIYNVGTSIQTTIEKIVGIAQQTLGLASKPEWGSMPERIWDTNIWIADTRNTRETLGWIPTYSIEEGFRLMVDWLQKDPATYVHYRKQVLSNA